MAGSAALTVQAVIAILDLHMLHDAWMYTDMPALEQALTVGKFSKTYNYN